MRFNNSMLVTQRARIDIEKRKGKGELRGHPINPLSRENL
jgi:hypothetical protein